MRTTRLIRTAPMLMIAWLAPGGCALNTAGEGSVRDGAETGPDDTWYDWVVPDVIDEDPPAGPDDDSDDADDALDAARDDGPDPGPDIMPEGPLVAENATARTYANVPLEIELIVSGADGFDLTYTMVTYPDHGAVELAGTMAHYSPPYNYRGDDSFTFMAGDGFRESNSATVSIAIVALGSCREILGSEFDEGSGIYAITTSGDGIEAVVSAYCDMAIDEGGWTLVGRSAPGGGGGSFGWKSARGGVHSDAEPYSLNADKADLGFTEILVGHCGSGKNWGDHAYNLVVPGDFISAYSDSNFRIDGEAVTVIGGCDHPKMFRRCGYTNERDQFFFRDDAGNDNFGLLPGRFDTFEDDCDKGGELNGKQGMVFVR
ncbi:MAG: fibrinogen-like YCDxxxxGGGW domain-containing protein [Pseudomonadota bacterium]